MDNNCVFDKSKLDIICFIILNYVEYKLTERCIDSILELDYLDEYNVHIVVVDNASTNGSGEVLLKEYQEYSNIHFIFCKENKGFAVGNNIGFEYIKERLVPKFVIAVNSDVTFCQKNFLRVLNEVYEKKQFWVGGPDIYVKDRSLHQNPAMIVEGYPSYEQVQKLKEQWSDTECHMRRKDMVSKQKYIREKYRSNTLLKIVLRIKRILMGNAEYKKQNENVCLQGPCLIFDKRFCENSSYLFRPATFMYLEEQFLCLDCFEKGMNMVYFPQLKVEHLDCGSTYNSDMSYDEYCFKKAEQMRKCCDSADKYLKYVAERNNEG